jgi:PadR family transcriptional regulator PadR
VGPPLLATGLDRLRVLLQALATAAKGSDFRETPAPGKVRLTYCAEHSTVHDMADADAFCKLELELRRGVVVLATLSQLRAPRYGYELRQALADKGMAIEEGTLYPLLRRLEAQGLLKSEWKIEDGPPRRYYSLNADGRKLLKKLTESWQSMNDTMDRLLKEG